ncbi:DNA polymerase I [Duganella callida]|uniref:DNA-directed DNA polymerase n=2 Tax=Duganella callida TaxID=2561932 RepID=A0A4Y9SB07_9BURK|nr:DNA polymerase I [Duganella callida]
MADIVESKELAKKYSDIFYRISAYDASVYEQTGKFLFEFWGNLITKAAANGEISRQFFIEIPVFNLLYKHIISGIDIETNILRRHKSQIDYQYYSELKNFSAKHNLPLEVPSDNSIKEYLEPLGYDFSGISIDYVLEFLSTPNNFASDIMRLRRIAASRLVLAALPLSRRRIIPIIDIFGSITSRIYFKDPVFQNLAKRHRDIITASPGKTLSYVDYDQFEVGIMAALSMDPQLLRLYNSDDIYTALSLDIFGGNEKRKIAKRLFLSYAYGMKTRSLIDAAVEQGADRKKVKDFFAEFKVFESWKKKTIEDFQASGRISSGFGNYQNRESEGPLSEKEKRAGVSQVVQGTAALIFKKALLNMRNETEVRILLPMHDAVLLEHPPEYDSNKIVTIFAETMSEHLERKVLGKASLEPFFSPPSQ